MNKLLILGIDSLDPVLISNFREYLPNMNKLMSENNVTLKSIFPPDTLPAWFTIFSGLNPAKHGLLYTHDIFNVGHNKIIDNTNIKGKMFWDFVSENKKRVCTLFPNNIYPCWPTNGVMICKSPNEVISNNSNIRMVKKEIDVYPKELYKDLSIPNVIECPSGIYPGTKNLMRYNICARNAFLDESEIGLKILKNVSWDVFFMYSSWLDIIQHFFWKYYDKEDPLFIYNNPFSNVIKEFYCLIDQVIGRFIDAFPNASIMILSDHGHGMRPTKTVNINEILRSEGLLISKNNTRFSYIFEKLKLELLEIFDKYHLDDLIVKIALEIPKSKDVYTSKVLIDFKKSKAYLAPFIGTKSYSEGGLIINQENMADDEYEKMCNKLIRLLSDIKDPKTDEKLIEWVCKRDELYRGNMLHKYPDIIFKLKEEFGVYWGTYCNIIGRAYGHSISSGGHKERATFLISNIKGKEIIKYNMTLMDVVPTILDLLEIKGEYDLDGESIFE